jgi:hypothetical protein
MIINSGLSPLRGLAKLRDVRSRRFSSFDRTGGNDDRFHIQPGETASIAETAGAGIVTPSSSSGGSSGPAPPSGHLSQDSDEKGNRKKAIESISGKQLLIRIVANVNAFG